MRRPRKGTGWVVPLLLLAGAAAAGEPSDAPPAAATRDLADMDLDELLRVRVSPFDVSLRLDKGYRASNSVSASRFDAPIQELPFAIQAFTEAFIADQRAVNLFDVARYSPSVTYRSNDFNEGNANLAIRGFAVSATPGGIQVLRDGFHGPSIFDFTNVSRVEVVKGPASFLYGQVAPGGIVNLITKSPQPRFAATASAAYGSYNEYRLDADVTGPAAQALFYRLAASYDQDMHYWDPYDAHSWTLSPSLLWQANERMSVSLRYESFRKVETPQLMQKPTYGRQVGVVPTASDPNLQGVEVPGLPDDWNSMSWADYRNSTAHGLTAWIDLRLDDHWNLRTAYSRQTSSIDALFSGNLGMANNTTRLQGRRLRRQIYANRGDTFQAEAVGRYRFRYASLRLLLGAQRVHRGFDAWAAQAPNDPALGNAPTASPLPLWDLGDPSTWNRDVRIPFSALTANPTDYSVDYVDGSVYGGATLGFFEDRLLVLAGWRLTSTENQRVDRVSSQVSPISSSVVTPQYGLLFKVTPGLSLFASYAESFVPGSQILNNPDGTRAPAAPTQGRGLDAGCKADLLDGRISGTLSVFEVRNERIVTDLAHTDSTGSVIIDSVQSGEQRSRGVELDATIALTQGWQLYLSYSLMDARILEFTGHDAAILAQDPATLDTAGQTNFKNVQLLHGAALQMSAPHLANLWTRHDFTGGLLEGAYLAAGVNVVLDQTILPDGPQSSRQSYALVNALAGYSWTGARGRVGLGLAGKNLGNQRYRPSQSTRARPREVLLTLTGRF